MEIAASQTWLGVAGTYVVQGIRHILFGADHMLFVLGLLADRQRPLDAVEDRDRIYRCTQHHAGDRNPRLCRGSDSSVECRDRVKHPVPRPGNRPIVARADQLTIRHPWVVAFAFGLLHGFGFASALTSAGLPRHELPLALVSFNVGVELGQLGFIALILGLERSFRILEVRWPRWVQVLPGYTVGSLGAFWTVQRLALLFGRRPMNMRRYSPLARAMALTVVVFLCAQTAFAHRER